MATSFTNATAKAVGITDVDVFTAIEKSIVIGGSIANLLSTTVPFTIKVRRGSEIIYVHKDKRIESGEPFELNKGNKLVLLPDDVLVVNSKLAASIDAVFSILQGVS